MDRLLLGLLSALRRSGVKVSQADGVVAVRAALALGVADRQRLRLGLSAVLAKSREDRARFERVFDAYFAAAEGTHHDLYRRLAAQGFTESELAALRALLSEAEGSAPLTSIWGALSADALAVARLLELAGERAPLPRAIDRASEGFWTMRLLDAAGLPRAEGTLSNLRAPLREALGGRGDVLADALAAELAQVRAVARKEVRHKVEARGHANELPSREALARLSFSALTEQEIELVEREVDRLAERLVGRTQVRRKRALRGRLDAQKTLRRALATGGVPFHPAFRGRQPKPAELVLLCDISDSVRRVARLLLLFVHRVQQSLAGCRSFVFVSDVGESTELFRRESARRAVELAYGGSIVSVSDNSQYARALRLFRERYAASLSRRTTLVVLGDARTNHYASGEEDLAKLAREVAKVYWLNPEPEARWGTGDSAMLRFRASLDAAYAVPDLEGLCRAARALAGR